MIQAARNFLFSFLDGLRMCLLVFFFANSFHIGLLLRAWCDGVDVWAILKEMF